MKNLVLVGGGMLGIGFAIGWMAKPVPSVASDEPRPAVASSKPVAVAAQSASESPPPGKRAIRIPEVKKPEAVPAGPSSDQVKKMQEDMSKAMTGRMRSKFEARIERLAEGLNLSPEQKDQLTVWLDGKLNEFGDLDFSDPASMASMTDLTKLLTETSLDEQLSSSLNAEQKEALAEFKEREHRSKVDTAALKSLSALQGIIEFEDGQRDEVYRVLTESADARILAENDKPNFTKMFTDGMGIEMDPYDLGLSEAMTESMGAGGQAGAVPMDHKQMAKNLREVLDQRVEAKVEQLRPVLNEKQLEQYRNELKTKGLGIYSSFLIDSESSAE
jgi:hypothetical protein